MMLMLALHSRADRRHRGAAMIETVLVLPVVLVILVLLLGLGRAAMRWQQASVMDRYEVWRQVADAPGPAADGIENLQLNAAFLRDEATVIDITAAENAALGASTEIFQNAATAIDFDAGWLAMHILERLPDARRLRFETSFVTNMPLEQQLGFAGPIRHGHTRLHHPWPYVRPPYDAGTGSPTSLNVALRDRYLDDIDADLAAISSMNRIAVGMRTLYLRNPAYGGPDVD